MPNDTRELPASHDGMHPLSRRLAADGGVPAHPAVDPGRRGARRDRLRSLEYPPSIQLLFRRIWDLGFDAINGLWRYFLLGAVIVIPVWLLSRMFGAPRGR